MKRKMMGEKRNLRKKTISKCLEERKGNKQPWSNEDPLV
jgi:hypothetical protein